MYFLYYIHPPFALFYHRPIIFTAAAVFLAGRFTALVVSRCGFRYQLVQIVDERGRSGRRLGYAEGLCQHHQVVVLFIETFALDLRNSFSLFDVDFLGLKGGFSLFKVDFLGLKDRL